MAEKTLKAFSEYIGPCSMRICSLPVVELLDAFRCNPTYPRLTWHIYTYIIYIYIYVDVCRCIGFHTYLP